MLAQQKAELNLIPGQIPTVINLNQFDILANGLSFTFYKGSESFDISGLTALIDGHKPDGNVYEYTGTISDNAAVFDITEQMTAAHGKSVCEVRLKDSDGNNIGTANFILNIEPSPLNTPIESVSDFPEIEDSIKNSKAYMEKAQESASSAESSAALASESAAAAAGSKDAAALSESNAKASETAAKASEANAAASESSASISEANAKASETAAKKSEENAVASEKNAKASETAAGNSAAAAETSETNAKTSETNSKNYYDEIVKKVDSLSVIDTEMSDESINAVQNKVIKAYVDSQKDETLEWLKAMVYTNNYWAQLRDESGNPILDENSNSILGNWSYIER